MRSTLFDRWLLYALAVVSFLCVLSSHAPCSADTDDRSIVVVREDDIRASWRNHYTSLGGMNGLEYGKLKHIPITWGIITDAADSGTGLSWAELKDYVDVAGGELASHSVHHTAMSSDSAYIEEVVNSKAIIEQRCPGYLCKTFLQPGTWTGNAYLNSFPKSNNAISLSMQANYAQSMAYLGGGWQIGGPWIRYGGVDTYRIDYDAYPSIDALIATLNMVAETPGRIFVITIHGIQDVGGTQTYSARADMVKALMDKLADLRDAGQIRLMGLDDAFHAQFSPDLNRIPDPGFELCSPGPLNPVGPWILYSGATISDTDGIDGSRCGVVANNNSQVKCSNLPLPPGAYELSWYQKVQTGYPLNKPLRVLVSCVAPPTWAPSFQVVNNSYFYNSAPDAWERKTAIMVIRGDYPHTAIGFSATSAAGYYIDNVALVPVPVNPAISPSTVAIQPALGQCVVAWNSPSDPSVTQLVVRYGGDTHPLTPSQGVAMGTVTAVAGSRQQVSAAANWFTLSYMFCSVFAMHGDGTYAPPGFAMLKVDTSPPQPLLSASLSHAGSTISASWTAPCSDSDVYQYQYGLGTDPSHANIVTWVTTQDAGVVLQIPSFAPDLMFFLLREQNAFGYWSPIAAEFVDTRRTIANILVQPDGATVTISGVISAVFADYFYVEQEDRARGIRVTGAAPSGEGTAVMVSGTLQTVAGERAIRVD